LSGFAGLLVSEGNVSRGLGELMSWFARVAMILLWVLALVELWLLSWLCLKAILQWLHLGVEGKRGL